MPTYKLKGDLVYLGSPVILGDVFNIPILTYFTYLNQKGKGDICIRCINSEKEGGPGRGGGDSNPDLGIPLFPHESGLYLKVDENIRKQLKYTRQCL
jgi:hypothetical protein